MDTTQPVYVIGTSNGPEYVTAFGSAHFNPRVDAIDPTDTTRTYWVECFSRKQDADTRLAALREANMLGGRGEVYRVQYLGAGCYKKI